jgi:hypothetical protein
MHCTPPIYSLLDPNSLHSGKDARYKRFNSQRGLLYSKIILSVSDDRMLRTYFQHLYINDQPGGRLDQHISPIVFRPTHTGQKGEK